ncbi:hypothetical protein SCHIN_v1c09120 [Spiroplasma chinense]|uniref:Uncharacterized protein n=1 Tax=Spiroplasma chinense TaxID=216932 RepID=A0A5B9Y735_9MOLU|nr:hypothetical protein [Spiroplasma chinense]QEH62107.1 hypothetical protein SCHIN_v1c09120 [Spiroplasma chinense]
MKSTNFFKEISDEAVKSSICLALVDNKINVDIIDEGIENLEQLIDKLDPITGLNVTNSIYYHYTNFMNKIKKTYKNDIFDYLRKVEQKSYLEIVAKLSKKVIH